MGHLRTIVGTDWLLVPNLIGVLLNVYKVFVQFNRLEFSVVFKSFCVLICQDHTLMLLVLLLGDVGFHIDDILEHFKIVQFLDFIHVLVIVRVLKHV